MNTNEPGDVLIKRLSLYNKALSAEMNPLDQLMGFDIFEDMSKPTMYATFVFNDAINLLENFPIIGEEVIEVEIETPGMSKSTTFRFRTFEVANVQKELNGKSLIYTLRCVSEEHLYNGSSLITQSFEDTLSNMVPAVLKNYLRSNKQVIVDQTKGIQTLVIPKINPLQTIDMIRQRAVSVEYTASSYVFFENQAGFNFKTIEGLIKASKKTIGAREYNAQENPMGSKQSQANAYRTILNYQNIARADSNRKAAQGVYKAITNVFDMNEKVFSSASFDMASIFKKLEKVGDGKQIPNTPEFIEEFSTGVPKQFFVPKDSLRPDNFIDTMVAVRNSFAVLLNSDTTRVQIHGDTGLKVGDMITLNLPQATGLTAKRKRDKLSSGNYLIIRLRHSITPSTRSKHSIVFDCVKMGI